MGLISAFIDGLRGGGTPQKKIPHRKEDLDRLLYPGELQTFQELAENNHVDERALVYVFYTLNVGRKKMPFAAADLCRCQDFGKESMAFKELKKHGLIRELDRAEELEDQLSQEDIKKLLKERGLKVSGKKKEQAQRLIDSGYKVNKSRKKKFYFTERGIELAGQKETDRQSAIVKAVAALKLSNYDEAVSAYREYDNKWGFVHISGKRHTIFAHYDIPYSRFAFFETYPMREVLNFDDYKRTLKAVLIAGLMRGCQEGWELGQDFECISKEPLNCPKLLTLFKGYSGAVLKEMREQMEFDNGNALEYYISHLEYLSRQR